MSAQRGVHHANGYPCFSVQTIPRDRVNPLNSPLVRIFPRGCVVAVLKQAPPSPPLGEWVGGRANHKRGARASHATRKPTHIVAVVIVRGRGGCEKHACRARPKHHKAFGFFLDGISSVPIKFTL